MARGPKYSRLSRIRTHETSPGFHRETLSLLW
jgi:hypothetical protein